MSIGTTASPKFATAKPQANLGELVKQSLGRCSVSPQFFDDFYANFTKKSPLIGAKFVNTEMSRQKQLLREGISFMIMFYMGSTIAENAVNKLGKSHCKARLDIAPDMYKFWIEALIETVQKHDKESSSVLLNNWRIVLGKGIEKMQSMYNVPAN